MRRCYCSLNQSCPLCPCHACCGLLEESHPHHRRSDHHHHRHPSSPDPDLGPSPAHSDCRIALRLQSSFSFPLHHYFDRHHGEHSEYLACYLKLDRLVSHNSNWLLLMRVVCPEVALATNATFVDSCYQWTSSLLTEFGDGTPTCSVGLGWSGRCDGPHWSSTKCSLT